MKYPLVYTIVLNWNQFDLTADCITSLSKSSYENNITVMVDNASEDGSAEAIRQQFPNVILLQNQENLGYSDGNNVGIRYALQQGADYIFLLNNDTVVDSDMLSRLVVASENDPSIGLAGPTMYYFEPHDLIWGGANRIDWLKADAVRHAKGIIPEDALQGSQHSYEVDYIDSCAVLVRREVFQSLGGLDSRYFINFDDLDLNMRARKLGYKIIYVPSAHMWHKVSAAMGLASPATTYYMTRNSLLFFWTQSPGLWKVPALFQIMGRTIRTVAAWTIKSQYRSDIYRRKRAANLLGMRDFFFGKFGRMSSDVRRACYGK